jgi:hypothetical protein
MIPESVLSELRFLRSLEAQAKEISLDIGPSVGKAAWPVKLAAGLPAKPALVYWGTDPNEDCVEGCSPQQPHPSTG